MWIHKIIILHNSQTNTTKKKNKYVREIDQINKIGPHLLIRSSFRTCSLFIAANTSETWEWENREQWRIYRVCNWGKRDSFILLDWCSNEWDLWVIVMGQRRYRGKLRSMIMAGNCRWEEGRWRRRVYSALEASLGYGMSQTEFWAKRNRRAQIEIDIKMTWQHE